MEHNSITSRKTRTRAGPRSFSTRRRIPTPATSCKAKWTFWQLWNEGLYREIRSHIESQDVLFSHMGLVRLFLSKLDLWEANTQFHNPRSEDFKRVIVGKVLKIRKYEDQQVLIKVDEVRCAETVQSEHAVQRYRWVLAFHGDLAELILSQVKTNDYLIVWGGVESHSVSDLNLNVNCITLNESPTDEPGYVIVYRHDGALEPPCTLGGGYLNNLTGLNFKAAYYLRVEEDGKTVALKVLPMDAPPDPWKLVSVVNTCKRNSSSSMSSASDSPQSLLSSLYLTRNSPAENNCRRDKATLPTNKPMSASTDRVSLEDNSFGSGFEEQQEGEGDTDEYECGDENFDDNDEEVECVDLASDDDNEAPIAASASAPAPVSAPALSTLAQEIPSTCDTVLESIQCPPFQAPNSTSMMVGLQHHSSASDSAIPAEITTGVHDVMNQILGDVVREEEEEQMEREVLLLQEELQKMSSDGLVRDIDQSMPFYVEGIEENEIASNSQMFQSHEMEIPITDNEVDVSKQPESQADIGVIVDIWTQMIELHQEEGVGGAVDAVDAVDAEVSNVDTQSSIDAGDSNKPLSQEPLSQTNSDSTHLPSSAPTSPSSVTSPNVAETLDALYQSSSFLESVPSTSTFSASIAQTTEKTLPNTKPCSVIVKPLKNVFPNAPVSASRYGSTDVVTSYLSTSPEPKQRRSVRARTPRKAVRKPERATRSRSPSLAVSTSSKSSRASGRPSASSTPTKVVSPTKSNGSTDSDTRTTKVVASSKRLKKSNNSSDDEAIVVAVKPQRRNAPKTTPIRRRLRNRK